MVGGIGRALPIRSFYDGGNFVATSDEEILECLPLGYRFKPTDEELIIGYLIKKIENTRLPANRIKVVNLYDFHPRDLFKTYKSGIEEDQLYVFTKSKYKFEKGPRADRKICTGEGYWRASQKLKPIRHPENGNEVGARTPLAFHEYKEGFSKRGEKTEWLMYEYTCNTANNVEQWVLCRIYRVSHKNKGPPQPTDHDVPNEVDPPTLPLSPIPSTGTAAISNDHSGLFHNQIESPTTNLSHMALQLVPFSGSDHAAVIGGQTLAQPLPSSDQATEDGPMLPPLPASLSLEDTNYQGFVLPNAEIAWCVDAYTAYGAPGLAAYDNQLRGNFRFH